VLGTFPRAFSQVTIYQVSISQMYIFPSGNFLKIRLGLLRRRKLLRVERCSYDRLGGRVLRLDGGARRLGQTLEFAALEIGYLGSCHLGKYPWEAAAWEKFFGKVPSILPTLSNRGCISLKSANF